MKPSYPQIILSFAYRGYKVEIDPRPIGWVL